MWVECVNLVVVVDQCDAEKEAYIDHVLEIIWHFTTVCVLNVTMVLIDHWRFHTLYSYGVCMVQGQFNYVT